MRVMAAPDTVSASVFLFFMYFKIKCADCSCACRQTVASYSTVAVLDNVIELCYLILPYTNFYSGGILMELGQ